MEAFKVFNEAEVNKVVEALIDPKKVQGVPSMLKAIVDERVVPMKDEDKDKYRKLVNRYVRQYGFMAQLMDFVDADLEKFYVFCKVFYKYLPYTKETLPMELLERIDLNKLRIQMNFEGQLELEDEKQTMKSSRIGEVGQKRDEDKLSIKEILHIVNSPWEQFLDENDKILKQIWDEILVDPEVTDAFNANNTWDILLNIVKDKFDEKIADQIEKYYNFAEVLEREKSLSLTLMRKFVEALAERTGKAAQLVYDESVLKECIIQAMSGVLADVCSHVRSLDEFVDELFFVLNQVSIPTLDGVNELIKNNLNNIYTNDQIRLVDKIQCFNSLVTKYEAYLKKLYYLIHDEEVEGQDGKSASLADSIHAFRCLWNLKYGHTEEAQKYSQYLQMLRDWRNDSSHTAPTTSEQEIDAAIQIVVAMYLYVTGNSITDLEMAGYDAGESNQDALVIPHSYSYDREEGQSYGMAAESFVPANELTEEQRIDVLRKSIVQMMNHGGYRNSDKTFCKQRHWIAVYRIAADEGFTIDGDYRYFKHIVDGMNLSNCKAPLNIDSLERSIKGVYSDSFVDWSESGLAGKSLDEYNDIKQCAEAFLKILSDNRPKK